MPDGDLGRPVAMLEAEQANAPLARSHAAIEAIASRGPDGPSSWLR